MRIAFICCSLEPGMDGVGDYTRLLADELVAVGHDVSLIALNDRHIGDQIIQNFDLPIPMIRFGIQVCWKKRLHVVSKLLNAFFPDLISLQYVPYGYDIKGLPIFLPQRLAVFAPLINWHLMFHETWVGFSKISPLKHRIMGKIQRYIAQDLVRSLKPIAMHTSNYLYQSLLASAGIHVQVLPLFSNVRVDLSELPWVHSEMVKLGVTNSNRNRWMLVGMFGSCHADFPLESQVHRVIESARRDRLKIAFLGVGGGNVDNTNWDNRIRLVAPGALVKHWGQQPAARVSAILQLLDQGLPMTPQHIMGKSGTAAAFQSHGVKMDYCYSKEIPEFADFFKQDIDWNHCFLPVEKVAAEFLNKIK